ncbi:hypothetical protein BpHYR1_024258 [Brachionus plicatilis]|uniref:Uncharacterized protein n=1 Tax=Brachionus plicatilis TaxID=10195 RepID=A0A3M7PJT2_BRAPC|nr:hypothetical protein BpHYR1_024258 [Brachionus plicatilis]
MVVGGQLDHETRLYFTYNLLNSFNNINECMDAYEVEGVTAIKIDLNLILKMDNAYFFLNDYEQLTRESDDDRLY